MAYTVLARKYRPQTFQDLVGQDHVSRTLENAIESDRVAHAFLFTGARGVGKTTMARLLAKALNCETGPTTKPCNSCGPCKDITGGTDLDVLEIDGASNNGVDDVRRLQESLPFRPARDRLKIVIVDEVHMLSTGAFNAFLKTLEEPPPHVKFIFATTELHKVPITIRSRCQRYDFRLIPRAVIAQQVRVILEREGIEADDDAIDIVAREAAGSLRDAQTVLDQLLAFGGERLEGAAVARGLGIADRDNVLAAVASMLSGDAAGCLQAVHRLHQDGLDVLHFARQLLTLSRDLVVLKVVGDDPTLVDLPDSERGPAMKLIAQHSAQQLERGFSGLSRVVEAVAASGQPALTLEMGLVRLADRPPLEPLAELVARLQALEARLGGAPPPAPASGSAGGGRVASGGGGGGRAAGGAGRQGASASARDAAAAPAPAPVPAPAPAPAAATAGADREPRETAAAAAPAPEPERVPEPDPEPVREPEPVPEPITAPTPEAAASPAPAAEASPRAGATPLPSPPPANDSALPDVWETLVTRLHDTQPALGAILEHGTPEQVDASCIRVRFREGSFHGRQAQASSAREALATVAGRLLGGTPQVEVVLSADTSGTTLAESHAERRRRERERMTQSALNHPRVLEALEVFPEAADSVRVELD
ncbi:MAG: DNA polymerase III subunit gamma/tau [Myxococcales bacterium]|nr:DNA polymerase III subunit gamma/tau [Myxococcales bacterium]